ncbi:MAG: hypothetical protein AAF004_07415 [Pseudomonadota bacterium]
MNARRGVLSTLAMTVCLAVALPAAAGNVNKGFKVSAGESSNGGSSVNGRVLAETGAIVSGDLQTVNGSVTLESGVQAHEVQSVNGRVRVGDDSSVHSVMTVNGRNKIGERVIVDGEVSTVNGAITVGSGSSVTGDVTAVNGKIELIAVRVDGDVVNTNGGMEILDGTRIGGSVIVKKTKNWWKSGNKNKVPRIVIGPNVVIEGTLVLEREVELYIHETATVESVEGKNIDIQRYSGSRP